jgi:hypothetical protein
MDESINTANKKQYSPKPPLSVGRIVGLIFAGLVTSSALTFVPLHLVGYAINPSNDMGGFVFLFNPMPTETTPGSSNKRASCRFLTSLIEYVILLS